MSTRVADFSLKYAGTSRRSTFKFLQKLEVPNLTEKNYKAIDSNIRETGSDLPRALLAYYYAFIHTMKRYSTSAFCPIVVDTPVQQDQDHTNAARMISFCLGETPNE